MVQGVDLDSTAAPCRRLEIWDFLPLSTVHLSARLLTLFPDLYDIFESWHDEQRCTSDEAGKKVVMKRSFRIRDRRLLSAKVLSVRS